jgi:dihydrofolate synthase/folylpolyglutamate synthase
VNSFREALRWLYATQLFGVNLGLQSMERLLAELGLSTGQNTGKDQASENRTVEAHSESGPRFIHVAGTNGKGSTCAMLSALCQEAGLKTGLYTSPHLISFRERIRLNGTDIPEAAALEGLQRIRTVIEDWPVHPTFFEIVTALALDWFQRQGADVVVLETGLGGRLDATNVVVPLVSVLTPIGLDHQGILGETLGAIATEKAGILKPGVPAVTARQDPAVMQVLEQTAGRLGCGLHVVSQPWDGGSLGLAGQVQRWNAALALLALDAAGIAVPPERIPNVLAGVQWPGRFQRVGESLVLDGAHNAPAAEALVATWSEVFPGEKASLVFGALMDKDVRAVLQILEPIAGELVLVPVRSPRALTVPQIAALVAEVLPMVPCRQASSLKEALAEVSPRRRLVSGSLYLVGEALGLLQGVSPEWSAQ